MEALSGMAEIAKKLGKIIFEKKPAIFDHKLPSDAKAFLRKNVLLLAEDAVAEKLQETAERAGAYADGNRWIFPDSSELIYNPERSSMEATGPRIDRTLHLTKPNEPQPGLR